MFASVIEKSMPIRHLNRETKEQIVTSPSDNYSVEEGIVIDGSEKFQERADQAEKDDLSTLLPHLSLVIPAYNEAEAIEQTVYDAQNVLPSCALIWEIIVISDGSTDNTAEIARRAGAKVIKHPSNLGYGNSLKTGILHAEHELIAICDADGSYPLNELNKLAPFARQFDMVVGQRKGKEFTGSWIKSIGRKFQLAIAQFTAGMRIPDVNSGLRIFRKTVALRHFDIICGGFSFTTSITLALMINGYAVKYVPIEYLPRVGKSHVNYFRDTLRSLQIITTTILKYNPIKAFLMLMIPHFAVMLLAFSASAVAGLLSMWSLLVISLSLFGISAITCTIIFGMGLLATTIQTKDVYPLEKIEYFSLSDRNLS